MCLNVFVLLWQPKLWLHIGFPSLHSRPTWKSYCKVSFTVISCSCYRSELTTNPQPPNGLWALENCCRSYRSNKRILFRMPITIPILLWNYFVCPFYFALLIRYVSKSPCMKRPEEPILLLTQNRRIQGTQRRPEASDLIPSSSLQKPYPSPKTSHEREPGLSSWKD